MNHGVSEDVVERWAEGAYLKLVARIAMALALPLFGIIWAHVANQSTQIDLNSKAILALTADLNTQRALAELKLTATKTELETRLNNIAERNNLQDVRIQRIENDLYRPRLP